MIVILLSTLSLLLLITLWLLYANTSKRYSELLKTMLESNQSYMKAIMAKNLTELAIADNLKDEEGTIKDPLPDIIPLEQADDKLFDKAINYKEPVEPVNEGITWPIK